MKTCFKCLKEKSFEEFYKHSQMASGYLGKCKECTKEDVRGNYRANLEHYKEYERKRYLEQPHRKQAIEAYAQTEAGKASRDKSRKKWLENNADKRAAHVILGNAVRRGAVTKPNECQKCGVSGKRIEGHHNDYSFPLEVEWLCRKCHYMTHNGG